MAKLLPQLVFLAVAAQVAPVAALSADGRPAITGISHMCVYAGDLKASGDFYGRILGGMKGADLQNPNGTRYYFSPTQFVEVLPLPSGQDMSRMACVAYNTNNAEQLRNYVAAHGVTAGKLQDSSDGSRWFDVRDPEGNRVQFVQPIPEWWL